jgi:hypothetical protein
MKIHFLLIAIAACCPLIALAAFALPPEKIAQKPAEQNGAETEPLPSQVEARGRARLLHEAMHSTLQIVHHRYFREDEGIPIPAMTLKSVFAEIETSRKVKLRWIAVEAPAMSIDHEPQDEFEREAAKAIAAGKEYELVENGVYKHAALITLKSECLKCHLPNRKSTDPRAAGLVISMPIKTD